MIDSKNDDPEDQLPPEQMDLMDIITDMAVKEQPWGEILTVLQASDIFKQSDEKTQVKLRQMARILVDLRKTFTRQDRSPG